MNKTTDYKDQSAIPTVQERMQAQKMNQVKVDSKTY